MGLTSLSQVQLGWWLALIAVLAVMQIDPPFPKTALLQHIPTVLAILGSPWIARRFGIGNAAFICVMVFLILHTIGGRYAYSRVPYDEWATILTGQGFSETFGWTRNHYDRLVHLAFGLMLVAPAIDCARGYGASLKVSILSAIAFVLAASCLYEVFEWLLTIAMAGEFADRYNGQQGDMWDAQKDMALAFLGSLFAGFYIWLRGRRTAAGVAAGE